MNVTKQKQTIVSKLARLGISEDDALALRRIEMTLQRWGVLETSNIERDEATNKPYWTYEKGPGPRGRYPIPDRETGALKRLAKIMESYPALLAYHQTDPRGCALYILRREELGGMRIDEVYSRGMAVSS
jgi:hypothetical protein